MIVERISREAGVSVEALRAYMRRASHSYKRYTIPKRRGGERIIDHPARPLKFLQRWVVRELQGKLFVHRSATAYHAGATISANAKLHAQNGFLLRIDFTNFFPSIRSSDIQRYFLDLCNRGTLGYSKDDIDAITSIVCRFDRLTIGAPSSPLISNAIMFEFDRYFSGRAGELQCAYSRYADDIYFSTSVPGVLATILEDVREYLRNTSYPRLAINEAKVTFTSRKRRRVVTGLIITPQGELSIGRRRKRFIRGLLHRKLTCGLDAAQAEYLQGLLAFVRDVEPSYIESLRRKFGEAALRRSYS